MGLPGFGRYPEPAVGARALFLDVSRNINSLSRTRSLLFNFVRAGDGWAWQRVSQVRRVSP